MTSLDLVLSRLEGVRKSSVKQFTARCPAHKDKHPSLSVSEGRDGRVLLHCFAGCTFDDIIAALGLRPRDLMPEAADARRTAQKRGWGP